MVGSLVIISYICTENNKENDKDKL
jgi:hypothetical protein